MTNIINIIHTFIQHGIVGHSMCANPKYFMYINPQGFHWTLPHSSLIRVFFGRGKMMMRSQISFVFLVLPCLGLVALSFCLGFVSAASSVPLPNKLTWHYYKVHNTCDEAEIYVRHQVQLLWDKDKTITPKLLRLLYSDCFVTVCASIHFY